MRLPIPAPQAMPSGRVSRWASIAASLRNAIRQGRLGGGEYLPSTRTLARDLKVHRNTVLVALDQLVAEGWIEARPRRGYVVIEGGQRAASRRDVCGGDVPRAPEPNGGDFAFRFHRAAPSWPAIDYARVRFRLDSATPDPQLLPLRELRAAYAFVLRHTEARQFDTVDAQGAPRLRGALCRYLHRVRALPAQDVALTNGSQAALALVAQALLGPGDRVAVEDPGYRPAWDAFRARGAEIVPIPVDAHGLEVEALARRLPGRVRLVYVTPARHYPTTVTLTAARRMALLELTRRHGIPIVEDDYNHEYCYRSLPTAPLAATPGAPHVIYVGSLSKLIAPAVRVGFVAAASPVLAQIARLVELTSVGGDAITQLALAHFIEDGALERHLWRTRRAYEERRDALAEALRTHCPSFEFQLPEGGLSLWGECNGAESGAVASRALEHGLSVLPEALVRMIPSVTHGLRLAFSRLPPSLAPDAARVLHRAISEVQKTTLTHGRRGPARIPKGPSS